MSSCITHLVPVPCSSEGRHILHLWASVGAAQGLIGRGSAGLINARGIKQGGSEAGGEGSFVVVNVGEEAEGGGPVGALVEAE